MSKLHQAHQLARRGVDGAGHQIRNPMGTRRSRRRAIRAVVLLAGLLGILAVVAAGGIPASAAPKTVTAGPVHAISSFYDPYTGDGSGGSLHVFSATPSGDYETYWFNIGSPKFNVQINNL